MVTFEDKINIQKYYNQTDRDKQEEIQHIEDIVKAKPTLRDLKQTVKLLGDFGIHISIEDIPDCYNVAALQRWRVGKIQQRKW